MRILKVLLATFLSALSLVSLADTVDYSKMVSGAKRESPADGNNDGGTNGKM